MLPLSPVSAYHRSQAFVSSEWQTFFSNGRAENATGGWRGVLFANLALVDPDVSWRFFTQPNFQLDWLDGGASRTWYLAFVDAFRCGSRTGGRAGCKPYVLF